jgi:sugar phosphate isomerase/epimerase
MVFGMPTLIELNSIEENILLAKDLGLNFIELNMNLAYCQPEMNDPKCLKQLSQKHQIGLTMHFPEEIDFGAPYEIIRNANIALFKKLCHFSDQIGVKKINVHLNPGIYFTLPTKKIYAYEKDYSLFLKHLSESMKQIMGLATSNQIEVCIENTTVPDFLKPTFVQLSQVEGLKFTYDIGHDAKANYNVESIYERLNSSVTHMHCHDFDGITDHQELFKGTIDLNKRLAFAKRNDMTVVIEVKTKESLTNSVLKLKEYGYL